MKKRQHDFSGPLSTARAARCGRTLLIGLASLAMAASLAACSGGGGDGGQNNGIDNSPGNAGGGIVNPGQPGGLTFTYPLDGQDDVYTQTQIALSFGGNASSAADGLTLVANPGTGNEQTVDTDVTQDANQSGIFRLQVAGNSGAGERPALQPNTQYAVQATQTISSGNTRFNAGDTLFTFTTRPLDGRPSANGQFTVRRENKIGTQTVPFTQFNPIRARFSEAVDEGSVKLCTGSQSVGDADCTVSVTGPNGNVPGKLTALGRYFTFDPTDDLTAGRTYTVAFGSDLKSAFGRNLSGGGFAVTPVSIGNDVEQNLAIQPANPGGDNALNGQTANVANIVSQLIGVNNQAASASADRGGLITRLAEPSGSARYINTFPALISAGQQFDLEGINLKLNGEVQTPVVTGNIKATFVNDADVYIAGNSLSNLETPATVLLRFDLGISTDVGSNDPVKSLSNGVFNQTAMNIVATGLAVPQDNGDVTLTTLGSFPASVNRTGNAITDFELELTLKAANQQQVAGDQISPTIIAQYPSACFYTFNTAAFDGNENSGATTLSAPEADCIAVLQADPTIPVGAGDPDATYNFPDPYANSLPLNASPSIVFSEPIDPTSLAGNITLTNVDTSTTVPVRFRSEGSSVVIDPVDPLTPDTQYTVDVSNGVTDLAGNGLTGNFPGSTIVSDITFNTEPMAIPTDANGQPTDISQDLTQRPPVRQTAPFLTVLTPGMPCPLQDNGDSTFRSGGDQAGRCIGDSATAEGDFPEPRPVGTGPDAVQYPAPSSAKVVYPVFKEPANTTVDAYFSKQVQASTIQMADGCLIGGSGNTNANATIAVQVMDGSGNCTGVVNGDLALLTPGQALTRGFSFRPADDFIPSQRYWIVVCGSADAAQGTAASDCSTGKTIHGPNGLRLNTNSLLGTGTRVNAFGGTQEGRPNPAPPGACGAGVTDIPQGQGSVYCRDDNRGQGGPDIVMPFDGAPATRDFYATTLALPETDTNGNGFFDNTPYDAFELQTGENLIGGQNTDETTYAANRVFDDSLGRERAQRANIVFAATVAGLNPAAGAEAGFLSGGRPVAIRQLESGESCAPANQVTFDDGTSVIGNSAAGQCVPVDLLPGGLTAITSLAGGTIAPTGRTLLRFPYGVDSNGQSTDKPQSGYIVPECQGSFQGEDYNYAPCFVANLRLTVNGNDGINAGGTALLIPQQDLNVRVFGPVAFEQNGRLVISTKNANGFAIIAYLQSSPSFPPSPLPAPTQPGAQSLQLAGPAIHGGRAFPVR